MVRVQALTRKLGQRRGFAMVELLLVTVITSTLMTIAVPTFEQSQEKALDHAARASLYTAHGIAKSLYTGDFDQQYPSTDQLVLAMTEAEPDGYTFRSAQADQSVSTGPADVSVNVDDPYTITLCARSETTRTFCARFVDGGPGLQANAVGLGGGSVSMATGLGPLGEPDATAALPTATTPPTENAGPTNSGQPVDAENGEPLPATPPTTEQTVDQQPTPPNQPDDPPAEQQPTPPQDTQPPADPTQPAETQPGSGTTDAPVVTCPNGNDAVINYHLDVVQGGTATATFSVAQGCHNIEISLASYKTDAPTFTLPQTLIDSHDSTYDAGGPYTETVQVNPCYYQVDFVTGPVIVDLTQNHLYNDLKLAWQNGGTACQSHTQQQPQTPPTISFTQTPPQSTPNTSATIQWSNSGGTVTTQTCKLDGQSYSCPVSWTTVSNLPIGSHSFEVDSQGLGGNDSEVYTWTITSPPSDRLIIKDDGDYATINNISSYKPTGAFEVGAWVNLYNSPTGSHGSTIASEGCTWANGTGCRNDAGWTLTVVGTDLHFTVNTKSGWIDETYNSSKHGGCQTDASAQVTTHSWHYVDASYDPAGRITLWVDGKLQACSGSLSGLAPKIVSDDPLILGYQNNPGGQTPASTWLNGAIGEFRMTEGGTYSNVINPGPASTPGVLNNPAENGRAATLLYHFSDWTDSAGKLANAVPSGGAHLSSHDEY